MFGRFRMRDAATRGASELLPMSTDIRDWVSYWDSSHSIYVNARHADVHYRDIARGIIGLISNRDARVLDYGCGEALHADAVAARCGELVLCEAAPKLRTRLEQRFAHMPNITVISPEDLKALPPECFDLIVANSVVQYLSRGELESSLAVWLLLLDPAGCLVVADVIPPEVGVVSDLKALLRYALAHGFFFAALIGVARTATSSYRNLRAGLGIAQYSETEFLALLAAAGYSARRLPRNMEHNQTRMAFIARHSTGVSTK
jgi:SAM-dependent methyltransferase